LRFADRATKYLSEGGLLSPEQTSKLFDKRVAEIDTAIIAESARWGDAQTWSTSRTKDDDWLPEINNLRNNYFPFRTGIVINQLTDENLYSSLNAPEVIVSGEKIYSEILHFTSTVNYTLNNSNSSGAIIYCLDGRDPRLVGGKIAESAKEGNSKIDLSTTSTIVVNARIKNGGNWGPLKKIVLIKENEDYSSLKVTELNYHPTEIIVGTDTSDEKSLEYIEFKNTGKESLDLSGLELDSAVTYTFPENTILQPDKYYIIASKPNAFFKRYGVYPNGNFKGQFSNNGEFVLLADKTGKEILSFTYSDKSPWPVEADGKGYSLTSVDENPTGDPNNYAYWKSSTYMYGSPYTNDDKSAVGNDIVSNNRTIGMFLYPNPTSGEITIDLLNSTSEETKLFVYNMEGKQILCTTVSSGETIDLRKYVSDKGIYFMKAITGGRMITRKILFTP